MFKRVTIDPESKEIYNMTSQNNQQPMVSEVSQESEDEENHRSKYDYSVKLYSLSEICEKQINECVDENTRLIRA